jgi:hypothetical protein
MKIRKIVLIITLCVLITIGLTFNSFATENPEDTVTSPDVSVENDSTNNDVSNPGTNEDTNTDNNNQTQEPSTGTDNNNSDTENDNTDSDNEENNNSGNENSGSNNDFGNLDDGNNSSSGNYEGNEEQNDSEYTPPANENSTAENNWQTNNKPVTQTKSENANLRTLILDVEGLSPEFDKDITDYYLIVDLTVEKINIEAYPEDINSIVMIEGNENLQQGENAISIIVKADAGNTKTYTINVTKTDDIDMVNANLKTLSVKGFNFYPAFKSNIYNYNLTINEKISQLEITVEPEIEGATYEIVGNENLVEGDNLIKVIVTAQDGMAKREYKLNVFMSSKSVEIQETNKTTAIVLLAVLGVCIIGTAIAISKRR